MKITTILLILFTTLFLGCGSDSNSQEPQDSSITPQPDVENEAMQPPKPPSI